MRQVNLALPARWEGPRAAGRPPRDAEPTAGLWWFGLVVAVRQAHICVEPPARDRLQDAPNVVEWAARRALLRQSLHQRPLPIDGCSQMGLVVSE
ncbi:hypothetical protein F01_560041 [Burkholderia cenocepacia]|nr:hypothetical protein F01_560041 [Burkholderia cenocepacia]